MKEIDQNNSFLNDPSRRESINEASKDFVSDSESDESHREEGEDNTEAQESLEEDNNKEGCGSDQESDSRYSSVVESVGSAFLDKVPDVI